MLNLFVHDVTSRLEKVNFMCESNTEYNMDWNKHTEILQLCILWYACKYIFMRTEPKALSDPQTGLWNNKGYESVAECEQCRLHISG